MMYQKIASWRGFLRLVLTSAGAETLGGVQILQSFGLEIVTFLELFALPFGSGSLSIDSGASPPTPGRGGWIQKARNSDLYASRMSLALVATGTLGLKSAMCWPSWTKVFLNCASVMSRSRVK